MKKQSVSKDRKKLAKMRSHARLKAKRPIHKKFLLHPAMLMFLLCVGVLLAAWSWRTNALSVYDSSGYSVKAKISAPPITDPAIITSPANGASFKDDQSPITVKGTCYYKSYLEIFRNDDFAGTVLCAPDGTFSLPVGLLPGSNKLVAHIFNVTDDEGPVSDPVNVSYILSAPAEQPTSQSSANYKATAAAAAPFFLTSLYHYAGYQIGQDTNWSINVNGGKAPYAFNVKWGDGSESNYVQADNANLNLQHSYSAAGIFDVRINGTDLDGTKAFLQLNALVVKSSAALITGGTTGAGGIGLPGSAVIKNALSPVAKMILTSYAVVVLMAVSYWLGERQEYFKLIKAHSARRR